MAWGDQARGVYAASQSVPTSRVAYLNERDRRLMGCPINVDVAEASTASDTYATIVTLAGVPLPVWVENSVDTVKLKARVEGKVDSNNGNLRLVIGATNGSDSTTITSASYIDVDLEITIPAGTTPADVSVLIQGKNDGGGAELTYVKNVAPRATFYFEVA